MSEGGGERRGACKHNSLQRATHRGAGRYSMRWQRPARALALLLLLGLLCGEAVGKPTVKKTAAGNAKKAAAGNAKRASSRPRTSALQNLQSGVASDVVKAASETGGKKAAARANALKVCVMTADFWGLKSAGGTATAYHLLAATLAKSPSLHVTFLGVSKKETICLEAKQINTKPNLDFECLMSSHFNPTVVETYPYEELSHGVVAWLFENKDRCDVIHGHEWGGAFVDPITMIYLRQVKPGLRFAVEPHGGHFWSSQGQVQRPMDVISLRIDNQERMANQLNDVEISPTNYMTAFLRQRGWKMPIDTITIPNIIPEVEAEAEMLMGKERKIWQLAFFSRLEERKGIKLFVEAINSLNITNNDKFEVYFVGTEAKIDMRPSSVWLKEKTAHWSFKKHLKVGVKRDEALEILSMDGMLLVLCSLIDNMPYVVAEAAVKGIPFLAFDAGGVLEMFDGKLHKDNVVLDPTLAALSEKLNEVVKRGSIKSVQLAERITTGREQWHDWHTEFAKKHPGYVKEDEELAAAVDSEFAALEKPLNIIQVETRHHALDLYEQVCVLEEGDVPLEDQPALLLLPSGYIWAKPSEGPEMLAKLMLANVKRGQLIGALTFGAILPDNKVSFPTSPTWMMYAGDDGRCMDNIPILIRPEVFCRAFLAEARVFRHYYSWVLAMLLGQQDIQLHSYPEAVFKVTNFTHIGYSCMPDKVPVDRKISFPVASNLYKDSEELLRNLHLAPYMKPIVSLIDDFPTHQRHKGWQFGYLVNDTSRQISWLQWKPSQNGLPRDGSWSCGTTKHEYPSMHHSLLHPCAGKGKVCCGNTANAPFLLRYESFFHSKNALLVLAYEVWPICGDGLDFVVRLTPTGPRKPSILLKRSYDADVNGTPNRQKIEWKLQIRTGDIVDFLVNPRGNHDCDGLYIVDIQIWVDNDRIQAS